MHRSLFVFTLLTLGGAVHGAGIAYDTPATFAASLLAGFYDESFDGGGYTTAASFAFTGGTPSLGFSVTAGGNTRVFRDGFTIGNDNSRQTLDFTPTTGNVSAFGGNFTVTDATTSFLRASVTVTATDSLGASLSQTYTPASETVGSFRGFTTTGFFTSIVVSATSATGRFNAADNVIVGRAAPVPEPASFAVLGLGAIALLRRRKRR